MHVHAKAHVHRAAHAPARRPKTRARETQLHAAIVCVHARRLLRRRPRRATYRQAAAAAEVYDAQDAAATNWGCHGQRRAIGGGTPAREQSGRRHCHRCQRALLERHEPRRRAGLARRQTQLSRVCMRAQERGRCSSMGELVGAHARPTHRLVRAHLTKAGTTSGVRMQTHRRAAGRQTRGWRRRLRQPPAPCHRPSPRRILLHTWRAHHEERGT